MRNPALRLVGFAASPVGGGVFGTRAEEELRQWLEARLDALGIDPVAYTRFVLSLLRRPNSALSPVVEAVGVGRGGGCRSRPRPRTRLPLQGDREQRRAVVQCLTSAADHKCGVESLVDELCAKLRELEGGSSNDDEQEECKKTDDEPKTALETLTPRDRALRYYAAFPALEPVTPKKFLHKKDRNSGNKNAKINNNKNNSKNNNNKICNKKTKMSTQTIDTLQLENKESFGFAKSMEREREKERELELDQLRLAQLQAKFDRSLEALWDSDPGNVNNNASIWAAPSLSFSSGPLWPTDITKTSFTLPILDNNERTADTPYQESIIDDSSLIQWDIDLVRVENYTDESADRDKSEYNLNWSESVMDGPWAWGGLSGSIAILGQSPRTGSGFFPVQPRKTPTVTGEESRSDPQVNSLPEPDEDLLTSTRTHFRPIKEEDDEWDDGTTFPVNNTFERVAYRKSECGNLLYLPGEESPYMEYREGESPTPANSLTLKFRVRQNDKSVQTEPIRSPVKRRILSEQDRFFCRPIEAEESTILESAEIVQNGYSKGQLGWVQPSLSSHNDRKRRHSSSIKCQSLIALRPLTL